MRTKLLAIVIFGGVPPAYAQTGFLDRTITIDDAPYRYQVYVPADYTPRTSWPVIVSLHGNGRIRAVSTCMDIRWAALEAIGSRTNGPIGFPRSSS